VYETATDSAIQFKTLSYYVENTLIHTLIKQHCKLTAMTQTVTTETNMYDINKQYQQNMCISVIS